MGRFSKIKRIIALCCCTILLSMSIFSSYNTVVYAAHDYDILDAADDVLNICLVIGGIIFAAPSGGLSYLATIKGIIGLRDSAENLIDYITDNGDGTYTINEQFIQAVLDAAEQLEAQGFTDKNVEQQNSGYLYNYKWSSVESYTEKGSGTNNIKSIKVSCTMSLESNRRIAGYKSVDSGTDSSGRSYISIVYGSYSKNGSESFLGKRIGSSNGIVEIERNNYSASGGALNTYNSGQEAGIYNGSVSFGGNFPIFSSFDAMNDYLYTGKGYRDAMNYRPAPLFRRHSSYSPTYSGGAVTVNRTVINNINQKITEVDADDSLSDDQKIEILQQYIFSGGNLTPTPPSAPSDPDYDDNKDLPAGEDLTDTNSWLKKIYLKVCQIYASMSDSVGQSMSEVVDSIEDMKKMLQKYLKEIAGDLDDIKGQLEEMTEEEFSDKTDSFLDETTESFSEIGELAKKKFPLSIPYDLYNLLAFISPKQPDTGKAVIYSLDKAEDQAVYSGESLSLYESNGKIMTVREGGSGGSLGMSAAGAPVFNLPIVVTSVGWDYTVTVDMTQFQTIADLSRTMFTLIFILGMIKLSILVIGLWGDIVD